MLAFLQSYAGSDDRPFFPIGIYSVNPPSAFEELKMAGFNTVHTYELGSDYLKTYIDHAEKLGLKVLIFPGDRIDFPQFDNKRVQEALKDLKKSPVVLAWYLSDEPDGGIPPERVKEVKDLVHQLDPSRPTSVVIANPQKVRDYAETADIIMVDPYPIPRQPLVKMAEAIDVARDAVGGRKPIWVVLQAFGYQSEKNKGWGWEREPTYEEMKAMTYLAITHKAKGIFYYAYHGSQYFIKDSPQHWRDLKRIVGELNKIYPLLAPPEGKEVVQTADVKARGSNTQSIHWIVKEVQERDSSFEKGMYLVAVNSAKEDIVSTFRFSEFTDNTPLIPVILEGRKLKVEGKVFQDHFAPYEVHIYRLR